MNISKDYLQKAILDIPWALKQIKDVDNAEDRLKWVMQGSADPAPSVNDYICNIESMMRKAIRNIDSADGNDIIMLFDTYKRIVDSLNSQRDYLAYDTATTLRQCLDTVTREMADS